MSGKKKYIVATRPSLLASTQTEQTVNLLRAKNPDIEFEIVKFSTQGDRVGDKPLISFGGTGIFVKELENAMIEHKADFAIHSLKDVPAFVPESLLLASFPKREDPRDVMLVNSIFDKDKEKLIIGTGSPRRIIQLAQIYKNAEFKDLRGNIDTRLRKLNEENYDAIILAAAGLNRLGKTIPENSYIDTEECIPAVSQGIIGIECRKDDEELIKILRTINDENSELSVKAERAYMIEMEGNCKFPLAAFAETEDGMIRLTVMVGNPETKQMIKMSDESTFDKAHELGIELANRIRPYAIEMGIK